MDGRCGTCVYWQRLTKGDTSVTKHHRGYGVCGAVGHYADGREYGENPIEGPFVVDAADDPYVNSRLITLPHFGCVEYTARREG